MAVDNRLVCEFQQNNFTTDIGSATNPAGSPVTTSSGLYGGIMPYRQAGNGSLSDGLASVSGFGTAEVDNVDSHPTNRMALFENEVHMLAGGKWWRQRADDQVWEELIAWTHGNSLGETNHTGLYACFDQVNNKRYLGMVTFEWQGASTIWSRVVRYNPHLDVMESGDITVVASTTNAYQPHEIQYKNNLFMLPGNTPYYMVQANLLSMEVFQNQWTIDESTSSIRRQLAFCQFEDQIYIMYPNTGNQFFMAKCWPPQDAFQFEFESAGIAEPYPNANATTRRHELFVDNCPSTRDATPALWAYALTDPAIVPSGGGSANVAGWSVWKLQHSSSGTLEQIYQNDALMGPYRAGIGENVIPVGGITNAVINHCNNHPGWFKSTPEKSFFELRPFGGEPGQSFRQWDFDPFDDTSVPAGSADVGGPAKVSYVRDKLGGGLRWSPAAASTVTGNDVNIFDIVYTSGYFTDVENPDTWRIHYKLMPSQAYHAGELVNVRWYFDRYYEPSTRCVLSSTSHGTLSSNSVTGITMMSGVDYYVDWTIGANGLAPGTGINLCGLVYTDAADIGSL